MTTEINYPKDKTYNWSSHQAGKLEYNEWFASLSEECDKHKIGFCVNETFAHFFVPVGPNPLPANANAADRKEYAKEKQKHDNRMIEFRTKYAQAAGFLKASLTYKSKARTEVDNILATVPPTPIIDNQPDPNWIWTPVESLKAALKHLKDHYSPSDATDVATLRNNIAQLTDEGEGGFSQFSEEFTNYYNALVRAGHTPDEASLREWAMNGIKNKEVRLAVSSSALYANRSAGDPEPSWKDIFNFVERMLDRIGKDLDPYKLVKTKAALNANVKDEDRKPAQELVRCTRCWREGHKWNQCKAMKCSECGKEFKGAKYCLGYESHKKRGTNWVPKFLLDSKNEDSSKKRGREEDASDEAALAVKNAKKALQVALKEQKKRRKEANKEE